MSFKTESSLVYYRLLTQTSDLFLTFTFAELCRFNGSDKSVFCYISISDKHFVLYCCNKKHTLRPFKTDINIFFELYCHLVPSVTMWSYGKH